jgi:hypothetical protein
MKPTLYAKYTLSVSLAVFEITGNKGDFYAVSFHNSRTIRLILTAIMEVLVRLAWFTLFITEYQQLTFTN